MTVMQYFIKSLMRDSSKITSSSYGSARPVGDNGTPEGRARNNRIEIVVKP
jgi:flagellar motor protein MotB